MDSAVIDRILAHGNEQEFECYYEILGCDELSTMEQIIAEYKARARLCHPDKIGDSSNDCQMFKKLLEAKETLCDVNSRKEYDQWRRSGIKVSYQMWRYININRTPSSSMHWQGSPAKKPMLMSPGIFEEPLKDLKADILRKFRNYEI